MKMWKYMTHNETHRYIDVLADLVHSYNHTYHSSIKMAPAAVCSTNVKEVWQNQYGKYVRQKVIGRKNFPKFKFNVGDHVRLSGTRVTFKKGYEQAWTEAVYTISRQLPRDPPVYQVKTYAGKEVKGVFYEPELQRVGKPDLYKIEEVLKTRKRKGIVEKLVKFRGYSAEHNSWIPATDIVDL
jgi:hypothetical protein